MFKQMPMDVRKDIASVVGFAETPFVLSSPPDSPFNSVAELTAYLEVERRQSNLWQRDDKRAGIDRHISAKGRS